MTANAVFSDIFTMQAFGDLTSDLKSLFLIQQCNQTCCTLCNNQILKTTSTIVLYITCPNILPTEFENCVSEAALPNSSPLFCDACQRHSGDISGLQHFVTMPKFLHIELSSISFGQTVLPASMELLGTFYLLKAVVRCASHHFTIAINNGRYWFYYDDLCSAVQQYATFQDILNVYANGWYFAVYESSVDNIINIHQGIDSCTLMPDHSYSKLEDKERQACDDFGKEVCTPRKRQRPETNTDKLIDRKRKLNLNVVNPHLKNYKIAKKAKETESEKLSRQKKQKEYMRAYRRKIKDYETGEEKQARLIKQNVQKWNSRQKKEDNTFDVIKPVGKFTAKKAKETESEKLSRQKNQKEYMRAYRRKIKDYETGEEKQAQLIKQTVQFKWNSRQKKEDNTFDVIKPVGKFTAWQKVDKPLHNVDKEAYLSQFDSINTGPIHVQKWAIKNMEDFHNSLKFKIYMCEVCHEAWPLSSKGKKRSPYMCSRCSRDKNGVKKLVSQFIAKKPK
nr:uncharacterized protein LOC131769209 [Pocillopora verrucosa]